MYHSPKNANAQKDMDFPFAIVKKSVGGKIINMCQ